LSIWVLLSSFTFLCFSRLRETHHAHASTKQIPSDFIPTTLDLKFAMDENRVAEIDQETLPENCGSFCLTYVSSRLRSIMEIKLADMIDLLDRTPRALKELLHGLPKTWTETNEGENTWSPFDVVGHLIHGEQVNWIPRAKMILEFGEAKVFEPFDRFAQFEASKGKTIEQLLEEFEHVRQANIRTLKNMALTLEDLQKRGLHPEFGRVTLGELLATWAAHDLDHVVQISRTLAKGYKEAVGPWRAFLSVLK
jgi:hypothetical protein